MATPIQAVALTGGADPILSKKLNLIPAEAGTGDSDPILSIRLKLTSRRGNEEQNQGNTQSRKFLSHVEPRLRIHAFAL